MEDGGALGRQVAAQIWQTQRVRQEGMKVRIILSQGKRPYPLSSCAAQTDASELELRKTNPVKVTLFSLPSKGVSPACRTWGDTRFPDLASPWKLPKIRRRHRDA